MAITLGRVSEYERPRKSTDCSGEDLSMMRIAVAGTGGLARLLAHYIDNDTIHQVVLLSRTHQPQLTASYQVQLVDYQDQENLRFALRGIDTVISTVTGPNQVELIKAAVFVRVRRFAPAEFEGLPQLQPTNGPLDRGRAIAQQWLLHYSQNIVSTTFVCGILYERFQPGGLIQSRMGITSGFSGEGDYIMDCRSMTAQVPAYDNSNSPNVTICMTAARDVARFVTKALDLPQWPAELRMCGQRVRVSELVAAVQRLKGQAFSPIEWHSPGTLRADLQIAAVNSDRARQIRLHTLIATAEGRYDFGQPNLNPAFPDVQPITFADWFRMMWDLQ